MSESIGDRIDDPTITSIEMVVRTSDGQTMTIEFDGTHNRIEVDAAHRTNRGWLDDMVDPGRQPRMSRVTTAATVKVTVTPSGGGGDTLYTVRTSPAEVIGASRARDGRAES